MLKGERLYAVIGNPYELLNRTKSNKVHNGHKSVRIAVGTKIEKIQNEQKLDNQEADGSLVSDDDHPEPAKVKKTDQGKKADKNTNVTREGVMKVLQTRQRTKRARDVDDKLATEDIHVGKRTRRTPTSIHIATGTTGTHSRTVASSTRNEQQDEPFWDHMPVAKLVPVEANVDADLLEIFDAPTARLMQEARNVRRIERNSKR